MVLNRRKDSNFFDKTSISSTSFSDHMVSWNFNSTGIALMVQSNRTEDTIEYSFNGTDVHGDMTPNYPSSSVVFDNRHHSKIWFRRATVGDPVLVRVESWRNEA